MKMVELREGTTPVRVEPRRWAGGGLIFALFLKTFFNTVFESLRTRLGRVWGPQVGSMLGAFSMFLDS